MTLEEYKKPKQSLEKNIKILLQEFETNTSLTINNIDIHRYEYISYTNSSIFNVELDIRL